MGYISAGGTGSAAPTRESAASRGSTRGRRAARRVGAVALLFAALSGATPVGRLEVDLSGLRSAKGLVRVCVTASPSSFPRCHGDPLAARRNAPASVHRLVVEGLPPGDYAAAVLHDENGNKRLDTFAGVPTEGFGFSRNPALRFGPPRFGEASFALGGDAETQQVRMRYMF